MSENKTLPTDASVEDFIAAIENKRRKQDGLTSLGLFTEITGLKPVMWGPSIIGFGECAYKYDSGREGIMPMTGFSPRKTNMTYYVGDKFDGAQALYAQLGKYKKSKACLYINKLEDVDLDVFKEIIRLDFEYTQHYMPTC